MIGNGTAARLLAVGVGEGNYSQLLFGACEAWGSTFRVAVRTPYAHPAWSG